MEYNKSSAATMTTKVDSTGRKHGHVISKNAKFNLRPYQNKIASYN